MKKLILLLVLNSFLLQIRVNSQPTSNPYRDKYPSTGYHWTDKLPWDKVYNINNYSGTTWEQKLTNAQNDIVSKGGGVLYFPAGDYVFTQNLTLRKGVIWRGDSSLVNDALSTSFSPRTRFIFPKFTPVFSGEGGDKTVAFKKIRSEYVYHGVKTTIPADTSRNLGIVDIDINRANIVLHPSYVDYIPSGAGATNDIPCYMENVILMGVRNNNVAFPLWGARPGYQNQWQEWPLRYMANLDALAQNNLVICNNRFNDLTHNTIHPISDDSFDQPGYKVWDNSISDTLEFIDGSKARFSYTNHYGLAVNRFYNFMKYNGDTVSGDLIIPNDYAAEPDNAKYPSLFNKGLEIMNNYMYNTQQVAFFVAGQGMVIKDNVIRDDSAKVQWVSRSGLNRIEYNAYLENRGIDFSGFNVQIENNDVEVYNTKFETSKYYSNDGEGIMLQECCGGSRANDISIVGNTLKGKNAYIGLYKTRDISNVKVENNQLNGQDIYLVANTNGSNFSCYNVNVEGNTGVKNITLLGTASISECYIKNNSGTGGINASCPVTISNNSGLSVSACTPTEDLSAQADSNCVEYPEVTYCFPPFIPGGDSICMTFPGDTGCYLNLEKAKWSCLQAGYPMVGFNSIADTIFLTTETSLPVDAQVISGYIDSVQLLVNKQAYSRRSLSAGPDIVSVPNDGIYHLVYKLWGCQIDAFSKELVVVKNSEAPTHLINVTKSFPVVHVYPNPVRDLLYISGVEGEFEFQCIQASGLPVFSGKSSSSVSLKHLPTGLYTFIIKAKGNVSVHKVIKN